MSKKYFFLHGLILGLLTNYVVMFASQDVEQTYSLNGSIAKKLVPSMSASTDFSIINSIARGLCNGIISSRSFPFLKQLCFARECDEYVEGITLYHKSNQVDINNTESVFSATGDNESLSRASASLAVVQDNHMLSYDEMQKFISILHGLRAGTIISHDNKVTIDFYETQEQDHSTCSSRKRLRDEELEELVVDLERKPMLFNNFITSLPFSSPSLGKNSSLSMHESSLNSSLSSSKKSSSPGFFFKD